MRVALIVPTFPKRSETFIVSKFLGLLARGWDVHVVGKLGTAGDWAAFPELRRPEIRARVHAVWPATSPGEAVALAPCALGLSALRQPGRFRRYLSVGSRRLGKDVIRHAYLDARLIELGPDLIHFEFGSLAVGRMYLKELLGCRIVVSFRGYDISFVGLEDPRYYEAVWQAADLLHALGQDLWHRALARGCPPGKPHRLIPPAIDTSFFQPRHRPSGAVIGTVERPARVLSVGRLVWKKGYEYALQAVRELVDSGVHCRYTIVGDGEYLNALAFARHQLGLDHVVEFAGALDREEIRDRMERSDVFLHAAVSEGFCNAVLEAQAMELPVVCSDAEGLSENVADGDTGFVVPRRDPSALAERLATLVADPALRRAMGRAGRQRVTARFLLPEQIAAFDQLYCSVLHLPIGSTPLMNPPSETSSRAHPVHS